MLKHELFNQDMVKAFLDGLKMQTRRPVKLKKGMAQFVDGDGPWQWVVHNSTGPKYQPGDIMGIRERARLKYKVRLPDGSYEGRFTYEADGTDIQDVLIPPRLKPIKEGCCVPNGCFKELARIFLKVTAVRVERIQDISHHDCVCEGIKPRNSEQAALIRSGLDADDEIIERFADLWDSCYSGSWERNDWVFVYDLERTDKP